MNPSPMKTAVDAIEALREVVKGHEDFVYYGSEDYELDNKCVNWVAECGVEPDEPVRWRPSCIVGHVLTMWGFPEDKKNRYKGSGVYSAATAIEIDQDATGLLSVAQRVQDSSLGLTWGHALLAAEWQYAHPQEPYCKNPHLHEEC